MWKFNQKCFSKKFQKISEVVAFQLLWSTVSSRLLMNSNSCRIFQFKLIKIEAVRIAVMVKNSESVNSIRSLVPKIKNPRLHTMLMAWSKRQAKFLAFKGYFCSEWCVLIPIIRNFMRIDSKMCISIFGILKFYFELTLSQRSIN